MSHYKEEQISQGAEQARAIAEMRSKLSIAMEALNVFEDSVNGNNPYGDIATEYALDRLEGTLKRTVFWMKELRDSVNIPA